MVELIIQVASLLSLLFGILIGEVVTLKVFGRPKPKIIMLDIVVFVLILVLIFNYVSLTELGYVYYALNFVVGLFAIILVRAVESVLKLTESPKEEEKIAVNVVRLLSRYGVSEEEIKNVLKRSGISPKIVDRLNEYVESNVPHYAPKLAKMEADIEEIKEMLSKGKRSKKR